MHLKTFFFVTVMAAVAYCAMENEREKRQVKSPVKKVAIVVNSVVAGVSKLGQNLLGGGDLAGGGGDGPTKPTPYVKPTPSDAVDVIDLTKDDEEEEEGLAFVKPKVEIVSEDEDTEMDESAYCLPSPVPQPHVNFGQPNFMVLTDRSLPFSPAVNHVMDSHCTEENRDRHTAAIDAYRAQIVPLEGSINDLRDHYTERITEFTADIDRHRRPNHPETATERRTRLRTQYGYRDQCNDFRRNTENRITVMEETLLTFHDRLQDAMNMREAVSAGMVYRERFPHHAFAVFLMSSNMPIVQRHRTLPTVIPRHNQNHPQNPPNMRKKRSFPTTVATVKSIDDLLHEMSTLIPNEMKIVHYYHGNPEPEKKLFHEVEMLDTVMNITTDVISWYYNRYYDSGKLMDMKNSYKKFMKSMMAPEYDMGMRIERLKQAKKALLSCINDKMEWYYDIKKVFAIAKHAFTFEVYYTPPDRSEF